MAIKLIIDSASDLTPQQAQEQGWGYLNLSVTFGEQTYTDRADLDPQSFYEKLIESDTLPVTSQISPMAYQEAIAAALAEGKTPVVITLSSKLSGSYQSACIAAAEFDEPVYIVDSLNVSLGEALLIRYAQQLLQQGLEAQQLVQALEQCRSRIRLLALLNTLEYLKKGGRISSSVALVGGLLSIKPVIAVVDGEVAMLGKARGSKQGNNLLVEWISKSGGVDFSMPCSLAYSGLDDTLLQKYVADSKALWEGNIDHLPVMQIGATIGTHAGPGAIAVAFFAQEAN